MVERQIADRGVQDPAVLGAMRRVPREAFVPRHLARRPPVVEEVARMIRATPPIGYAGCCHAIPKIDTTARLGEIRCPIQIIVGEQDAGTPVAMSQAIHEAAPGSELVILPDASHLSNLQQPEAFDRALLDFLGRAG